MPGLGQQKPYLEALTTPYSPREGQKPVLYLSREPRVDPVLLTTLFPQPPRWGLRNRPINVNHYANKKSAAESMLDIALLMANASQLKAVVEQGNEFAFFVPLVVLISISLVLQIGVGVLLIFLVKYDLNNPAKHAKLDFLNNLATGLVFIIVVVNIFITAFGVQKPVMDVAPRQ